MNWLKIIKNISILISFLTLILVGLGGFVRATGAGLSCPDWPLCFDKAVPEMSWGVAQEVIHRYLASFVSFLTILFAIISFRLRKAHSWLWKVSLVSLVVLFFQVIMGGLTVLMKLNTFIVTGHLILGTTFFIIFAVTTFKLVLEAKQKTIMISPGWKKVFGILSFFVFTQIALGGFIGSSGAALACPDIPLCFGQLFPDNAYGPQYAQMFHRLLGMCIALAIIASAFVILSDSRLKGSILNNLIICGAILVVVQIALGFSNVYFKIPVSITVLHLVVAELILLTFVTSWLVSKTETKAPASS
jgi:cytochrome c oxidase assembly protein subunit 15